MPTGSGLINRVQSGQGAEVNPRALPGLARIRIHTMSRKTPAPALQATTDSRIQEQIDALRELRKALLDAKQRPSRYPIPTEPGTNPWEWREKTAIQYAELFHPVVLARKRVLKSGYTVPNEWLGVDAVGTATLRWEKDKGWWMEETGSAPELEQIVKSICIALQRLVWGQDSTTQATPARSESIKPSNGMDRTTLAKRLRSAATRLESLLNERDETDAHWLRVRDTESVIAGLLKQAVELEYLAHPFSDLFDWHLGSKAGQHPAKQVPATYVRCGANFLADCLDAVPVIETDYPPVNLLQMAADCADPDKQQEFIRTNRKLQADRHIRGICELADMIEQSTAQATGAPAQGEGKVLELMPLIETSELKVFEIIKSQKPGKGIQADAILRELDSRKPRVEIGIDNFNKKIIPLLKKYGVKNRKGVGYYYDPTAASLRPE